jgi:hypothetical protein
MIMELSYVYIDADTMFLYVYIDGGRPSHAVLVIARSP